MRTRRDNYRVPTAVLNLTARELELVVEALQSRAARHETMDRCSCGFTRSGWTHADSAAAMRVLALRLMAEKPS
jgi:hypothetical protein